MPPRSRSGLTPGFAAAAVPEPPPGARRGLAALAGGIALDPDRLPMLHAVIARLARLLSGSCRGLAAETADITIDRARPLIARDFAAGAPPALIAVIRLDPWGGHCLVALDTRLVGTALDLLLGGRRNEAGPDAAAPRHWTALERAVIERLIEEMILPGLERAFAPVGALRCTLERLETDLSNALSLRAEDAAIGFCARFALDGRGGIMEFLIPAASLKPVRDRLAQDSADVAPPQDDAWLAHLGTELPRAHVTLQAVIERRRISTAEVLRWRVGSSLALNRRHDDPIELFCNDTLVLRARIAEQSGRIALHVDDRRLARDWKLPA